MNRTSAVPARNRPRLLARHVSACHPPATQQKAAHRWRSTSTNLTPCCRIRHSADRRWTRLMRGRRDAGRVDVTAAARRARIQPNRSASCPGRVNTSRSAADFAANCGRLKRRHTTSVGHTRLFWTSTKTYRATDAKYAADCDRTVIHRAQSLEEHRDLRTHTE